MNNDLQSKVKDVIEGTIYCNVATASVEGAPWNTPVYFGYDDKLNIYFRSWKENIHSKNLALNPRAFITIYDSQTEWGEGFGVYMKGAVTMIEEESAMQQALDIMGKRSPRAYEVQEFMGENPRRIYKFTPEQIWVNVDGEENGQFVDTRQEVEWAA